jgi:hypothetical protein
MAWPMSKAAEAGPSGWAAVLCGLVDTMLAHRKLFILHQRNQTALSGLHIKGHGGDHEEMEQQFRRILGDPAIPARDRVRLSCALGALLSSLMTVSDLGDLSIETYGDLLRETITGLLPRSTRSYSDVTTWAGSARARSPTCSSWTPIRCGIHPCCGAARTTGPYSRAASGWVDPDLLPAVRDAMEYELCEGNWTRAWELASAIGSDDIAEPLLRPLDRLRQPARGAERAARNQPCPCGSGRKYKACCRVRDLECGVHPLPHRAPALYAMGSRRQGHRHAAGRGRAPAAPGDTCGLTAVPDPLNGPDRCL